MSRHYFVTGHTGRLEKIARPEPSCAFFETYIFWRIMTASMPQNQNPTCEDRPALETQYDR
jgi:hypothetical protein